MIASDTAWSEPDSGWTSGGHGALGGEPAWSASGSGRLMDQDERHGLDEGHDLDERHDLDYPHGHDWAPGRAWDRREHWDEDDDWGESDQGHGGYQDPARGPDGPENRPDRLADRPEAYRLLWQPPGRRPAPRQALGRLYVWDGGQADQEALTSSQPDAVQEPAPAPDLRSHRHRRPVEASPLGGGPSAFTERAVIGDHLRELAAWCQIGTCISRHTDAEALGERDIRNKAVAAGWCVDLFGRLVCPSCQQRYPVWCARPPAPRIRQDSQDPAAAGTRDGRHGRMI